MKSLVPGMSCIELSCSPKETPQKPPNKPDYGHGYCLFSTNWWQDPITLIKDNTYITHWTLRRLAGAYLETCRLLFIVLEGTLHTTRKVMQTPNVVQSTMVSCLQNMLL